MTRLSRAFILVLCLLALPVFAGSFSFSNLANGLLKQPATPGTLSDSRIAAGIKQALAKGTRNAVAQLGRKGGFWGNAATQIPLPGPVAKAQSLLTQVGEGAQVDQVHELINRAAEQAVPAAADVFGQAVQNLTLKDVRNILDGPQDAATQYFKRTTSASLQAKFEPIVARVTSRIGVVQQYDQLMSRAGPLTTLLGPHLDLNGYITRHATAALFTRVAAEEKAIRTNPAARTTELLKSVFGPH